MIDFIKLNISYIQESDLLNNPLIVWKRKINLSTGELEYPIEGTYYNMDIKINPIRKEMSGSIHKLRNEIKKGQNQNYDDFTFDDLTEMIYHIRDIFNLDMDKTIIENLECGLNINTHHKPETILYKNLIVWSDMEPSRNLTFDEKGKYIMFEKSQVSVKIYDKGKQAGHSDHIMRIEWKADKNEYIRKCGTRTLNDLLDRDKIQKLLNHLYNKFKESIIVDDIQSKAITDPRDKEKFNKGTNPKTWTTFEVTKLQDETDDKYKKRQKAKDKAKERFNKALHEILEKYNLNTIKKEIDTNLRKKGEYLLKCRKMTDISTSPNQSSTWSENTEMSQNDSYIYGQYETSYKCIITGIDISHQKANKVYILGSTINELQKKDPATFQTLFERYRPERWDNLTNDELIKEMAHRIRRKKQSYLEKTQKYRHSFFPLPDIPPGQMTG